LVLATGCRVQTDGLCVGACDAAASPGDSPYFGEPDLLPEAQPDFPPGAIPDLLPENDDYVGAPEADFDGAAVVADAGQAPDLATGDNDGQTDAGPWRRDWTRHPSVFAQMGASRLWGLSDVHGDRDRLFLLVGAAGLVRGDAISPVWAGGSDTMVVSGDNIDKGSQSVEVLDFWMALIPQAELAGGNLVVLLGNHEAEFLADPSNSKAAPLVSELGSQSASDFASSSDPHGRFLRELPIAALVDGWFFSHAGNPGGKSVREIGATFQTLAAADAWSDSFFLDPNSILEARSWWPVAPGTNSFLDGYLAALPGNHFVFGHHPTTFADPPSGNIEAHCAGRLVLIDVGMSAAVNYSMGKLLRVDAPGTPQETARMVDPAGRTVPLDLTAP